MKFFSLDHINYFERFFDSLFFMSNFFAPGRSVSLMFCHSTKTN